MADPILIAKVRVMEQQNQIAMQAQQERQKQLPKKTERKPGVNDVLAGVNKFLASEKDWKVKTKL